MKNVNISFMVPVNVTDPSGRREIRVVDVYKPMAVVGGRKLECSIEDGYYLAAVSKRGGGGGRAVRVGRVE